MRSPGRRRLALLVAPAATLTALNCSTATRDRLAHFFFEIPTTTAPAEDERPPSRVAPPARRAVTAAGPFESVHRPFAQRRCFDCHDSQAGQSLIQPWADKCASCHTTTMNPGPVLHGPFGALACNECHLPHASALPALLRQPEPDLCLACHEPTLVRNETYHADIASACTACHHPHGGADYRLLRSERLAEYGKPSDGETLGGQPR